MHWTKSLRRVVGACTLPYKFVSKISFAEHRIQQCFYIRMGCMINVKIETPGTLQYPVHFHNPYTKPTEICTHIITGRNSRRLNYLPNRRPVVFDLLDPVRVCITLPRPPIFKLRTCR